MNGEKKLRIHHPTAQRPLLCWPYCLVSGKASILAGNLFGVVRSNKLPHVIRGITLRQPPAFTTWHIFFSFKDVEVQALLAKFQLEVREGSLDGPILDFLPELSFDPEQYEKTRKLLTTSGTVIIIEPYDHFEVGASDLWPYGLMTDANTDIALAKCVRTGASDIHHTYHEADPWTGFWFAEFATMPIDGNWWKLRVDGNVAGYDEKEVKFV